MIDLIVAVLVGAAAGWLAGKIMKSKSEGIVWNVILGIVGGFFGGWLFSLVGMESGSLVGSIITATVGASLLIFLNRKLFKR